MGRAGRAGQRVGPDPVAAREMEKAEENWEEAQKGGKRKCPNPGLEVSQSGDWAAEGVVG